MSLSHGPTRPVVALDGLLVNRRPTGVGRSIIELVQALARRDRGLDFLLLATEPEMFAWLDDSPGWRVIPCPGARGGTLRKALFTQVQVPRICARYRAAILHSLQFVAPLRLPCRSMVTVHDLAYLGFPGTVEEPRLSYYRFFVPRTLRRAATIVTNSLATAADTASFFPETRDRITPTYFGTPSWVWDHEGDARPLSSGRPYFLFVGTLEPRKNLEKVLQAYRLFLDSDAVRSRPMIEVPSLLFIGGKGWKDSTLQEQMRDLATLGHLEVLDYCETGKLWGYYRTACALLFPSLHEGFGFPILEAMAAGLPVLTSNRGAMAEVGGQDVVAVNPADAEEMAGEMARIAWDNSLRETLKIAGLARARNWTWDRTADLTEQAYHNLLAQLPGK